MAAGAVVFWGRRQSADYSFLFVPEKEAKRARRLETVAVFPSLFGGKKRQPYGWRPFTKRQETKKRQQKRTGNIPSLHGNP